MDALQKITLLDLACGLFRLWLEVFLPVVGLEYLWFIRFQIHTMTQRYQVVIEIDTF